MTSFEKISIQGKRVYIRPMAEDDATFIVKWRNDPVVSKFFFIEHHLTVDSHLEWFRNIHNDRIEFVVCLSDNNIPIGTVSLKDVNQDHLRAEGGKMIGDQSQWGKGLAKEAFVLLVKFTFEILKLNRIYVYTDSRNIRNIELNIRLGFKKEGILRKHVKHGQLFHDVVIMGLLREDAEKLLEKEL